MEQMELMELEALDWGGELQWQMIEDAALLTGGRQRQAAASPTTTRPMLQPQLRSSLSRLDHHVAAMQEKWPETQPKPDRGGGAWERAAEAGAKGINRRQRRQGEPGGEMSGRDSNGGRGSNNLKALNLEPMRANPRDRLPNKKPATPPPKE